MRVVQSASVHAESVHGNEERVLSMESGETGARGERGETGERGESGKRGESGDWREWGECGVVCVCLTVDVRWRWQSTDRECVERMERGEQV